LTGGEDRSYALGLTTALADAGVSVEFVGSDKLDAPELHHSPRIRFLNLRGDQREDAGKVQKVVRVLKYYWRLVKYAATTRAPVLHILWNNKFEVFDRTVLMLYYRLLGKKIVFTAHNVNGAKRDGRDNWLNRATLKFQYHWCHHIFVHTDKMKQELVTDFGIPECETSIIPFGINNTSVTTALTPLEARARLGLKPDERVLLFFGQIAPYKGLEYLVDALIQLNGKPGQEPSASLATPPSESGPPISELSPRRSPGEGGPASVLPLLSSDLCPPTSGKYRLIIAGKVKQGCEAYWAGIQQQITEGRLQAQVLLHIRHIPEDEVEVFFKAADAVALPYVNIFQSGVPFLAYSFGLPVIAADVGSLKTDIVEGQTGYIFKPCDAGDLLRTIECYFASELYSDLKAHRQSIRDFANERYSWSKVAAITTQVYSALLAN